MAAFTLPSNRRIALLTVLVLGLVFLFLLPQLFQSTSDSPSVPPLYNSPKLTSTTHTPPSYHTDSDSYEKVPISDLDEIEGTTTDIFLDDLILPPTPKHQPFIFNTSHVKSYGLTDQQCDEAFPGLFYEIDRAHKHLQQEGNLTLLDIDRSAEGPDLIRILIYDGQIYIVYENTGVQRNRAASILSSIHRAIIASTEAVPNVEFTLSVADYPTAENQWALTRDIETDKSTWVMTDHVWWSWPVPLLGEYSTIRKQITAEELAFDEKVPQLMWRGVVEQGPIRAKLLEVTDGKSWSNVRGMHWAGRGGLEGGSAEALSAWDQCNFQYLAYTEGVSYSGRFKYLHNCNSVIVTHKLKWAEYHSALFVTHGPDQNIVEVERDFSDLEDQMIDLLENPSKAKMIAENNAKTFRDRYLTPAAQACYARKIINAWSQNLGFRPSLRTNSRDEDGNVHRVLRGKPFETWLVEPMV